MRQFVLAAVILASCLAPVSLGCRHEQAAPTPPGVAAAPLPAPDAGPLPAQGATPLPAPGASEPAPLPIAPPDVSEKIRRIAPQRFELERPVLALLAGSAAEWRRESLNGQVVFMKFGRKLKLSPEQVADNSEGVRAYLDLDARIAHSELVAQQILSALGTRAEDHPGALPMDKARHALDEYFARLKADDEANVVPRAYPADIPARLAAAKRALASLGSLQTWQPALDGTAPALLGFEERDVIKEVNGRPVKSFGEIFDELSKLGTRASLIEVKLQRNGKPVALTYQIVDK